MITLIIQALVLTTAGALADPATLSEIPTKDQSAAITQDSPPNFSGHWVLNTKKSDDLAEVMREALGSGHGGRDGGKGGGGGGRGGGAPGGGRGGGGRDGSGGSGNDEDRQVKAQQKLARAQEEYSRLDIFHDGIELNVTNGLDISRLLYTDGRQMSIWTQHGEAEATASWQGKTLVVMWKTRQDTMSRIRYFSLAEGGMHLTLTESRRLPEQDKTLKIKMVYDLQKR